jgi:hypothetical protein
MVVSTISPDRGDVTPSPDPYRHEQHRRGGDCQCLQGGGENLVRERLVGGHGRGREHPRRLCRWAFDERPTERRCLQVSSVFDALDPPLGHMLSAVRKVEPDEIRGATGKPPWRLRRPTAATAVAPARPSASNTGGWRESVELIESETATQSAPATTRPTVGCRTHTHHKSQ